MRAMEHHLSGGRYPKDRTILRYYRWPDQPEEIHRTTTKDIAVGDRQNETGLGDGTDGRERAGESRASETGSWGRGGKRAIGLCYNHDFQPRIFPCFECPA